MQKIWEKWHEFAKVSEVDKKDKKLYNLNIWNYSQFLNSVYVGKHGECKVCREDDDATSNDITYSFVLGPFVWTLMKAKQNPSENFLLIIKEKSSPQKMCRRYKLPTKRNC